MMMPSIALPTGPYDWHPEESPRAIYEQRLARLLDVMRARGVSHAVVHGNEFDHEGLAWLTHFTPKLGPAYALIAQSSKPRLQFAGGPGMKPSAQRLTWIEDVSASRGIGADVGRWLNDLGVGAEQARIGLYEGTAMRRRDWLAVNEAGGTGRVVELDAAVDAVRAHASAGDDASAARAGRILALVVDTMRALARPGVDLRAAVIDMERVAYAAGAQDVRVRMGRRPGGQPVTLPDEPLIITGPTQCVIAVRGHGVWAERHIVLEPER